MGDSVDSLSYWLTDWVDRMIGVLVLALVQRMYCMHQALNFPGLTGSCHIAYSGAISLVHMAIAHRPHGSYRIQYPAWRDPPGDFSLGHNSVLPAFDDAIGFSCRHG
jgi:hypothetical protein